MTEKLTFTIASVPDRDYLVAELWYGDEMWGEIAQEKGYLTLELYPSRSGQPWCFKIGEVEKLLHDARGALLGQSPMAE